MSDKLSTSLKALADLLQPSKRLFCVKLNEFFVQGAGGGGWGRGVGVGALVAKNVIMIYSILIKGDHFPALRIV